MHLTVKSLLALALSGCALAAQAAADGKDKETADSPKAGKEDCVFSRTVHNWQPLDDNHLVIWGPGNKESYLVRVFLPLTAIRFNHTLAFVDGDKDGRLCGHGRDSIADSRRTPPEHSSITSISRLDAEGVAKLEEKYKTKISPESRKKQNPKKPAAESAL